MLTWDGKPLRRTPRPAMRRPEEKHPLQKHLEILADAMAAPPREWWPTMDSILALPETTDCCPLEWVEDEA